MNSVTIECEFKKLYPCVDRTLNLTFSTREVIGDDVKALYELYHQRVALAIVPVDGEEHGVYQVETRGLTKSQQLRREILTRWEALGKPGEFKEFYNSRMDEIIRGESLQKELFESKT